MVTNICVFIHVRIRFQLYERAIFSIGQLALNIINIIKNNCADCSAFHLSTVCICIFEGRSISTLNNDDMSKVQYVMGTRKNKRIL